VPLEKFISIKIITIFISTLFYVTLSVLPLVFYKNNIKLKTLSTSDFPTEYNIFSQNKEATASLFFPTSNRYLYFQWSPYPIVISQNGIFKELFTNNVRLVNDKQGNLYDELNNASNVNRLFNVSIFNLKNIFVFKDIRNAKSEQQFDWFQAKDYVTESQNDYQLFKNDQNFVAIKDNAHFAQFQPKDTDNFEYSIYSPRSIIKSSLSGFLSQNLDIKSRPVLIDNDSFHKPNFINTFQVPAENQDIYVDIKASPENGTKYYLKLSNVETSKPFLLQLNQTFGTDWKLHWVDKSVFDGIPCLNNPINYSITNNSVCNYKSGLFELGDAKFISAPKVSDINHFEGNFVGNTWVINPDDIPVQMRGQKELYAVLIYEKQTYYSYSLLISGLTFLILLILTAWQEIKLYKKRKVENSA